MHIGEGPILLVTCTAGSEHGERSRNQCNVLHAFFSRFVVLKAMDGLLSGQRGHTAGSTYLFGLV